MLVSVWMTVFLPLAASLFPDVLIFSPYLSSLLNPSFLSFPQVLEVSREVCREVGPDALALCDAFDISDSMLSAPIAHDWVTYNDRDNQGEL